MNEEPKGLMEPPAVEAQPTPSIISRLIAKPRETIAEVIDENLHHLKKGWMGFAVIFTAGVSLGWWIEGGLDAKALQGKDATIQGLQTRSDNFQKDNEVLLRENTQLKASNAEFTAPLKTRLAILVQQLREFHQKESTNTTWAPFVAAQEEFRYRFEQRIAKAISQLDEAGYHSDLLNTETMMFYQMQDMHFTNAVYVANELERLSKNLK